MLPCNVINFFSNNQPDALIIPIVFRYITLHVSGILSAHHQGFSTVHSTLLSFMQIFDDRFQTESGWNCSSILTLFGNGLAPVQDLALLETLLQILFWEKYDEFK